MNIILANAVINNGNRGCVALSVTSMILIDEILKRKGVVYKLYLPDSGFHFNGKHIFKIGDRTIEYNSCGHYPFKSLKYLMYALVKRMKIKDNLLIYKSSNYILDIGQGDSFSDIYGLRRFNLINKIHEEARLINKPYCILPQTIGPFKDARIKAHALKAIERASCVMARDKQSYDFVKKELPNKPVSEIIDVAFFMPYEKKTFNERFIHVGLNISALLWHGGYTQDNQFGLTVNYQRLIRNIIEYFLSLENVKLHLISHVVGADRGVENDYAVAYDLCEEYNHPNLILSPLFLDAIAAKGYIAGMNFFMGARMHATIAAFSSGVPVFPMAYSRKFNGLFVDTLQYKYMGDMIAQKDEEILQNIKDAYTHSSKLKEIIDDRMSTTVEERRKLLIKNLEHFLGV